LVLQHARLAFVRNLGIYGLSKYIEVDLERKRECLVWGRCDDANAGSQPVLSSNGDLPCKFLQIYRPRCAEIDHDLPWRVTMGHEKTRSDTVGGNAVIASGAGMEVARYQVEQPILRNAGIPEADREKEVAKQLEEALKGLSK
jgi:hypothetical protein